MDGSLQFGSVFWCTTCAKPRETAKKAVKCCFWQQKKSARRMLSEVAFLAKYRPSTVIPPSPSMEKPVAEKQRKAIGAQQRAKAPTRRTVMEAALLARKRKIEERRVREERQRERKLAKIQARDKRARAIARRANRVYGAHLPANPFEIRGRTIVRRFVNSCKGIFNLRQILFDAYFGGVRTTKYDIALKVNADIIGSRSDYICEYLFDTRLGLSPDLTPEIDAWLRASPSGRWQIAHRDLLRHARSKPKRTRFQIDWAKLKAQKKLQRQQDVDSMIDEEVDQMFVPRLERTKQQRWTEDSNNLYPIGYQREQTCERFATFCGVFRNFRERLAWSYANLKSDAQLCTKYFDACSRIVKIVVPRLATCQSDDAAAHGEGSVSQTESQNVIITTAREISSDGVPRVGTWINSTTEDTVGSFPELLERWNPVHTVQWTTSQARDSGITELSLPYAAITDAANRQLISYAPFYNHQYWRGDMEIRIEANVNKFMVGQLQSSFYYGWDYDDNRNIRKNIYSLSQCQHVIIDAGGSNSGTLMIPFKHQSACVPTRGANGIGPLYVGTLHIRVLSPLSVPDGQPTSCGVVVYMRFLNSQFTGQISRGITALPQMEATACYLLERGAERLLDTVMADPNRDNPTSIVPPAYVVPTGSHSWSVGTGIAEPLHALRLDSAGQTHHPTGISNDSHTTVRDIVRTFGLFDHFTWGTNNTMGSNLYIRSVNPTDVHSEHTGITLKRLYATPIHVMSALFAQWRGSIEYRFDIVASQFHTGRIMIAFIPNATLIEDAAITFDVAKSSYNVVIDLHEQRSYTFVAPYVHSDPWNRRRYHMDGTSINTSQHGKIVIFVMCPLNCPDTVSQQVDVMVYMRAGQSFELAIPIQPSLGLGSNTTTITWDWNNMTPLDGQSPCYLGTWDGYYGNSELVVRWGVLAGRVCEFPRASHWNSVQHAKTRMYWWCDNSVNVLSVDGKETYRINHYAIIQENGMYVAWPTKTSTDAIALWRDYMARKDSWKSYIVRGTASDWIKDFALERQQVSVHPQGERDNAEVLLDPSNSLLSTGAGRQLYGESFIRLKDIMRRYQVYGRIKIDATMVKRSSAMIKFPVIPAGLELQLGTQNNPDRIANKCREGITPIILSGYRYYRGSIRFRVVVPAAINGSIWVQHRPDCWNTPPRICDATSDDDELSMLAHGYAMYVQHVAVNGVIEFEVPFYQTGVYGLLGPVSEDALKPYSNNGTIVIGCNTSISNLALPLDVYYSLGDDFNFNTFQGFMPMVDAASIALADSLHQPRVIPESLLDSAPLRRERTSSFELVRAPGGNVRVGKSQMFNWVKDVAHKKMKDTVTAASEEVINEVRLAAEEAMAETNNISSMFDRGMLADIISNLTHIANSPTIRTVAISVISMLTKLGLKVAQYIELAVKFITVMFARMGISSTKQPSGDDIEMKQLQAPKVGKCRVAKSQAQNDDDDSTVYQWISALVAAISLSLGIKQTLNFDKDPAQRAKFMLKFTTESFACGNTLLRFLKNHCDLITGIKDWIMFQIHPEMRYVKYFKKEDERVRMWIQDAIALSNVDMRRPDLVSESYMDKLTACECIGREIMATFCCIDRKTDCNLAGYVEKYYDKIRKILKDQISRGKYPYLRIKPLHIQLHGDAGVGKTCFIRELSQFMLRQLGVPIDSPNYTCFVDSSDKFWNQCDGKQPVVVIDDIWAVTTPNILESQLTTYFALYGNTVFSPPMAAVEDKKMRYAPTLMVTTTNKPQVKFANVDEDALKRRRDFLLEIVKAPLEPEARPNCAHCQGDSLAATDPSELLDFHHLLFYNHNIFGKSGKEEDRVGRAMTWPQLREFLIMRAVPLYKNNKDVYEREVQKFAYRDEEIDDTQDLDVRIQERYNELKRMHMDRYVHVTDYLGFAKDVIKSQYDFSKLGISTYWKKFLPRAATGQGPEEECVEQAARLQQMAQYTGFSVAMVRSMYDTDLKFFFDAYYARRHSAPNRPHAHVFWEIVHDRHKCIHCKPEFLESYFVSPKFHLSDGSEVLEDYQCEDCILHDAKLKRLWMSTWFDSAASKRMHFKARNTKRIPKMFLAEEAHLDIDTGLWTRICDKYTSVINAKRTQDTPFWRAVRFLERCMDWLANTISEYMPAIMALLGMVATALGVKWYLGDTFKYIHPITMKIKQDAVDEAIQKYEAQGKLYAHENPRVARVRVPKPVAQAQSGESQQGSVAEALVRLNSAYITIEYTDDTGFIRRNKFMGLILYERKILLQRHYIETIRAAPKDATVRFKYVEKQERMIHGDIGMQIDLLNCHMEYYHYEDGKRDSNFVLVTLPKQINCHKNLVKFMAPAATHPYVGRYVLFVRPGSSTHRVEMNVGPGITISGLENNRFSDDIEMDRTYEYKMSAPGYCGSIIIDPALQHPIIGMHVAGLSGRDVGIAEILTREAFEVTPSEKTPIVDIADMDLNDLDLSKINLSSQLYVRGTVAPEYAINQSSETSYTKSVAVGKILPVLGEPMPLSSHDPRMCGEDPLALGCNHHGLLSKEFPRAHLDVAQEDYQNKILINVKPIRQEVGVLTYNDAIVGVPEIPEFAPLEWSTSEGFPLMKLRPPGVRGKKWLFDLEKHEDGSESLRGLHPKLMQLLQEQELCRRNGVKPTTVYVDCLKDEVRAFAKARTPGKTRVISTCPVQYLIAFKRYFGDFMGAFKRARFNAESGIGMNADSSEWSILARHLQQVGPKIVAGDYSKFGYTLSSEVLSRTFKIMNAWYAKYSNSPTLERDQLVRSVIAEEGINVTRLARNLIYDAPCGIASGFPTTDISNTMVNNMYVRLAWQGITGKSMKQFNSEVRLVTYGDDLIMNVSDSICEEFNAETMQHYFAQYDIKFTDIDKTGSIIKYRTLSTAPFLKREFVKHPTRSGCYLAQIDEDSISGSVNWVKKKDEPVAALVQNCRAALELAYSHGPEYYKNLYSKIQTTLAEYDVHFVYETWYELDNRNLGVNKN